MVCETQCGEMQIMQLGNDMRRRLLIECVSRTRSLLISACRTMEASYTVHAHSDLNGRAAAFPHCITLSHLIDRCYVMHLSARTLPLNFNQLLQQSESMISRALWTKSGHIEKKRKWEVADTELKRWNVFLKVESLWFDEHYSLDWYWSFALRRSITLGCEMWKLFLWSSRAKKNSWRFYAKSVFIAVLVCEFFVPGNPALFAKWSSWTLNINFVRHTDALCVCPSNDYHLSLIFAFCGL